MANTRISEIKTIRVKRVTCKNPTYLAWFNELGGLEHWVFDKQYGESLRVFNGTTYKQHEPSIRRGNFGAFDLDQRGPNNGQDRMLKKEAQIRWLLTATDLDKNDRDALESLISSVEVVMLLNQQDWQLDGPEWMNVRIDTASWELGDSERGLYELQFEIILQDKKIPWQ